MEPRRLKEFPPQPCSWSTSSSCHQTLLQSRPKLAAGTVAILPIFGPRGHLLLQNPVPPCFPDGWSHSLGKLFRADQPPHGHLRGQHGWAPGICEASPAGHWASRNDCLRPPPSLSRVLGGGLLRAFGRPRTRVSSPRSQPFAPPRCCPGDGTNSCWWRTRPSARRRA